MATIPTLDTSDTPSTVVSDIQTGLNNLNTDKIEATQTVTLTNKTINADSNTISNLETDNIKASAKTGADTELVTGTAGTNGNLSKWNADGDLVDSSFSVVTSISGTSTTQVPTESAVVSYVTAQVPALSNVFLSPRSADATYTAAVFGYVANSSQAVQFVWQVPSNYTGIESIKFLVFPDATESIQYDLTGYAVTIGENITSTAVSELDATTSVTSSQLAFAEGSTFGSAVDGILLANDYLMIDFASDTSDIRVIGCQIKYTTS